MVAGNRIVCNNRSYGDGEPYGNDNVHGNGNYRWFQRFSHGAGDGKYIADRGYIRRQQPDMYRDRFESDRDGCYNVYLGAQHESDSDERGYRYGQSYGDDHLYGDRNQLWLQRHSDKATDRECVADCEFYSAAWCVGLRKHKSYLYYTKRYDQLCMGFHGNFRG